MEIRTGSFENLEDGFMFKANDVKEVGLTLDHWKISVRVCYFYVNGDLTRWPEEELLPIMFGKGITFKVIIRPVRLAHLKQIYPLYDELVSTNNGLREQINSQTRHSNKWTTFRITRTWFFQIALVRLTIVSQTSNLRNLFTKAYDPTLFQIEVDGNIKGSCCLRKSPGDILRIETFALENDVGWDVHNIVLSRLMKYAKTVNTSRILISTCSKELSQLLHQMDSRLCISMMCSVWNLTIRQSMNPTWTPSN